MMIASRRQICMGVTLTVLGPFMTTNLWSAGTGEPAAITENVKLDQDIKPYQKVSGVSWDDQQHRIGHAQQSDHPWAEGFESNIPM